MPANPEYQRSPGIDVLRGVCVLLVVLHHIHLRFVLSDLEPDLLLPKTLNTALFWSGYYAVRMFFVISGFLIASLSIRRWGALSAMPLVPFYRLRAARILPPLLLLLLILSTLHLAGVADFHIRPERASLAQALLAALTFRINWLEGHHGYLPGNWDVLWSLSIEETFYLAFPLLCLLVRHERWLWPPLLLLTIVGPISRTLLGDNDPWNDYAYLSCLDGVAWGCVAALLCARLHVSQGFLRLALGLGAALALLVLIDRDAGGAFRRWGLEVAVLQLGVALMLWALGRGVGSVVLAKGTRWLRAIGHNSYEIYLFHMFIVFGGLKAYVVLSPGHGPKVLWYVGLLLMSVLLGSVLSRYYSEPLNRALRASAARPESLASVEA